MSVVREPKLASCPRCRAIFVRTDWPVCQKCVYAEEADFSLMRDALSENPHLTPDKLSKTAKVTLACVLRMLDDKQLSNENPGGPPECAQCQAPALNNGQGLCLGCLLDLDRRLGEELKRARANKKPPLRGVARHVHEILSSKRRT